MSLLFFIAAAIPVWTSETTIYGPPTFQRSATTAFRKCGFKRIRWKRGKRSVDTTEPFKSEPYACARNWLDKHYPGTPMGGLVEVITY
jgi:hypothetical protein